MPCRARSRSRTPARRHDPAARRRHADLHAGGRGRRPRHGRHARDPRRRSSEQRLPPAPDHQGDGLAGAGLCPHPADPRPRRRQAQQAPRRAGRRRLSRHGLPAGGAAQLPAAAGLGPWRRRDHLDRAGDRMVRPAGRRPLGRALRHGQAHQPQCPLPARDARRRAAAAGAAADRGQDRRQGRSGRPGAHHARPERREAALAHAGRARRQSRLLCPQRRAADRRRQGARPAHARGQGAARQARRRARGEKPPTGARSRSRTRSAASPKRRA